MKTLAREPRQSGFTILELLIAMAVFLLICGAIFGLLELSQKNYGSETQISSSFQEARLAVDQIVSDFNQSGFPSLWMFSEVSGLDYLCLWPGGVVARIYDQSSHSLPSWNSGRRHMRHSRRF